MNDTIGHMAWESIAKKTRSKIKEDVFSIYEQSEAELNAEDISKKMGDSIPADVIACAIGELIDEGKVVEGNISIGDIGALVRQLKSTVISLKNKIYDLENKVDIIAGGVVLLKRAIENESTKDPKNDIEVSNNDVVVNDGTKTEDNSVN